MRKAPAKIEAAKRTEEGDDMKASRWRCLGFDMPAAKDKTQGTMATLAVHLTGAVLLSALACGAPRPERPPGLEIQVEPSALERLDSNPYRNSDVGGHVVDSSG
jgi:hypothetical protein